MRKIIKRIIRIFVALLIFAIISVFVVFYFYPSLFVDFYIGKDEKSIWVITSPITFSWKMLDTSPDPYDLEWSPDEKYLAYSDFVREVPYDKEYFLNVISARTLKKRTVFIGTDHTVYYRWVDNNTIRVYVSVGTGMRIYRDIDIHLKEPFVAIDHLKLEDSYLWIPQAWWDYDDLDEWSGH